MDLYSIQVAVEGGWSTYLEPTSDVAVLHDTLTRLRNEGCPCRLVKCKVMKEYPAEKQDDTLLFAADRMYDAIRAITISADSPSENISDLTQRINDAESAAHDYDAALSAATPDVAARVRRTL
jgi:hypothetical protein